MFIKITGHRFDLQSGESYVSHIGRVASVAMNVAQKAGVHMPNKVRGLVTTELNLRHLAVRTAESGQTFADAQINLTGPVIQQFVSASIMKCLAHDRFRTGE
jgi:hypothetical protein